MRPNKNTTSSQGPRRLVAAVPVVGWVLIIAAVVALVLLALVAVLAQETWARNAWDSHVLLANAERLHRLGGTYYTAGSDHKGPLWSAFYDLALIVAPRQQAWFAIAGMIVIVAAATGVATAALLRSARIAMWASTAVGIAVGIQLVFGPEEWSRTLYSRNIVILMSTVSFAIILTSTRTRERSRLLLLFVAGAIMGLAVQTNLASAPTALVGLAAIALLIPSQSSRRRHIRSLIASCAAYSVAFIAALISAVLWYAARGVLEDFWALWWTYNVQYAIVTRAPYGLTYLDNLVESTRGLLDYYASQPILAMVVVAFVACYVVSVQRLSLWERRLGFLLIVWLAAEMAAVALTQRLFGHYLVLMFIPVAVMAGALLGKIGSTLKGRGGSAGSRSLYGPVTAALIVLFVVVGNSGRLAEASKIAADFRSPEETAARHADQLPAETQRLREIVDSNSEPSDFVYAWTIPPFVYDRIQRSPATRYVSRNWLTGRVYGGGASRDYILPGTWERWVDDMRVTTPRLVITFSEDPVPVWTPLTRLLRCGYEEIYSDDTQAVFRSTSAIGTCLAVAGLAAPTPMAIDELVIRAAGATPSLTEAPVVTNKHSVDIETGQDGCLVISPVDTDPYVSMSVPNGRGLYVTAAEGGLAQIFLDDGSGYSEAESVRLELGQEPNMVHVSVGSEPEGSSIRVDPPNGQQTTIFQVPV